MSITIKNLLNWTQDSALYGVGRIPGLHANAGKVAVAVGCRIGSAGDIKKGNGTVVGVMISTNGGVTFSTLKHIINLTATGDSADDPCVVISNTGRIWVFATTTVGLTNVGESPFVTAGAYMVRTYSDDNGATWSTPVTFDLPYDINVVSSGSGLCMDNGTLVIPMYTVNPAGANWKPLLYVSNDNGDTWTASNTTPTLTNMSEIRVIDGGDGYLYIISRNGNLYTDRLCWRTSDFGVTWEEYDIASLPDAGLNLGLDTDSNGNWWYSSSSLRGDIYGSATNKRAGGKLMRSDDKGKSFKEVLKLTPEDPITPNYFFGYSSVSIDGSKLYCLYEGGSLTQTYSEMNLLIMDI